MLVLSRKIGEKIVMPECGVEITITSIRGSQVCLGISAPSQVSVHRQEVWQRIREECRAEETGLAWREQ
jgi:carbon storage regulator